MLRAFVPSLRTSALAAALLWASTAHGATLFDPALRFRSIATEHFIVYFHGGEERLAPRLAAIAEETWQSVPALLGVRAPSRTHVVLADQTDAANGWAFPLPYNTIVVTAAWPSGSDFIGNTDDWLRLVFVHEFTHIVHLDQADGWSRVVRRIFGRAPLAFPNLFLPTWQIEGLATYAESTLTGSGRMHAGDFRQIEREAARSDRLEPLDRLNGGYTSWPNGLAPYAYGMGFHSYLAERFGASAIAELTGATAGRVPYTASRVFLRIFKRSLGELWDEYQTSLTQTAIGESRSQSNARRLTSHGFIAIGPRVVPCRGDGCVPDIVYSLRTPGGFPELRAVSLDGGGSRRLATRYGGSTLGVAPHVFVFDQQEIRRNVGVYSDLFLLDRITGQVRAVTSEQRVQDPDLSPDASIVVAVRESAGTRDLVLIRLGSVPPTVEPLVREADTQFGAPRWSPDGRSIAVERLRRGGRSEIVIVDPATGALRAVAAFPDGRVVNPAWRPDGAAIVAAVSRGGQPFNLHEFGVGERTSRQLTFTTGGAIWPDVAADGRLVYSGYTADGFDIFTLPYPSSPPAGRYELPAVAPPEPDVPQPEFEAHAYAPWRTLAPTSWTPVIESDESQLRAGVAVAGHDVLRYHAYAAAATWLLDAPSGASRPAAGTPDWSAAYAYDRWRPTLVLSASTATSFFGGPARDTGEPSNNTVREREIAATVLLPFRRVRHSHLALASVLRSNDTYTTALATDRPRTVGRHALRFGWSSRSARSYGYSISPEDGVAVGATAEVVRRAFGSLADATIVTADARGYISGVGAHHVLAIRAAGGFAEGHAEMSRTFLLGGAAAAGDVINFSRGAFSLLRAFPSDGFAGTRVAVVNADYRWPIARPERGVGTWPVFLRTVHAALFADAGHAWSRTVRGRDLKASAGGEISLDIVAGYAVPLTVTVGAGWGRDGARRVEAGAAAYVRVGRAF